MKYEHVHNYEEIINKAYKPAKVQQMVLDFWESSDQVVKVIPSPGEYKSTSSMQSSHRAAIRRLNLPIAARIISGELYLIKLQNS